MKLAYVSLCGFRGFFEPTRIEIPSGFAIIAGPNGTGKSTVCDALEFVLTGGIRASSEHREKGESIHDYLWWRGARSANDNHVEVGFILPDGSAVSARRTPTGLTLTPDVALEKLLIKGNPTLKNPLAQLCRTAILRDEEITRLSVDLRETDRFEFVTGALGAADFGVAEANAKRIGDTLKRLCEAAERDYERQRDRVTQLTTRLSQLRIQAEQATGMADAEATLRRFVPEAANAAELVVRGEREIAIRRRQTDDLKRQYARLTDIWGRLDRLATPEHRRDISAAEAKLSGAEEEAKGAAAHANQLGESVERARADSPRYLSLAQLLEHGRRLGLQDGRCPLCGSDQTLEHFRGHLAGLETSINRANGDLTQLSRESAEASQRAAEATNRVLQLRGEVTRLQSIEAATRSELDHALQDLLQLGVPLEGGSPAALPQFARIIDDLQAGTIEAERALSVLNASQAASHVVDVERELSAGGEQLAIAERRLSSVNRALNQLKEAGHTIKRVEGELIDQQLGALSPLLVELYERLRPHIDWQKVRYVLRGDVRRMLSLEVGPGLNPSFVFSSGQRRAAGLAFLLSIFLSRSWCELRTLVLDDPVQHVDDYRALHLTEVLSAIRRAGHQVVCTVEDRALAELLARRLRSDFEDQGALIELAYDAGKGARIAALRSLAPLTRRIVVAA